MLNELKQKYAAKAKAMQDMNSPDRKWNAAVDQPAWDAMHAELQEISAQIRRIEIANAAAAEQFDRDVIATVAERVAVDKKSPQALIFAKWLRGGDSALSAEDWNSYRQSFKNTMSTTTNSQGGYTVQIDVATTVLDALKQYGGMRAVSDVFQTAQGNQISYPTSDGTSETGEIIAQNATANSADIVFNTLALNVYKFSSKIVTVPFELLQDSNVDVEAFVLKRLTTRLGRITNTKFTIGAGDGSSEPNGVVTAAQTGVTAANSTSQVTAVIYNSLVNLQHSVDPAYRAGGVCKWMMHDQTVKSIRQIVDGESRPIFIPGYQYAIPGGGKPGGIPDTLLGDPIQVNQDVAQMAASAKSILYGDFTYYKIRDVMDVTMFRFNDSAYTKLGQVGFLAWMRSGGNLIDIGGAVKTFVNAVS